MAKSSFSILPANLKIELKKGFFNSNFNAGVFNKLFQGWKIEKDFCEKNSNGELYALQRSCVVYNLSWNIEQFQQMLGYFNTIIKIQENNARKIEIEAMCDGKVTFEQLKNEFPKWEFRPYYKNFGYRNSVLCGYTIIIPNGTNHNYGAYIKKADFYSPDEVRETLKKFVEDQKIHLEDYYKSQMAKLNSMFDD